MKTYEMTPYILDKKTEIFKNMSHINLFEFNFETKIINLYFSMQFTKTYNLNYKDLKMNMDDYFLFIHDDHKQEMLNIYYNLKTGVINDQGLIIFKIKYPNSNNYCWVKTTIQKVTDSICYGVQVDINDLIEKDIELEKTKKQFELILNNAEDLIAQYDINGNVLFASPSYCKMFDYEPKDIIGKSIMKIGAEKINKINHEWLDEVLKEPYTSSETINIKKDNQDYWISWKNNAVLKDGKLDYIISVGHDVTEIIKMNKILEKKIIHDNLTGLLNREGIYNELNKFDKNNTLASFFIDINNFKYINDYYGHEVGDKIIKHISVILSKFSLLGCVASRFSGDKFVLLLPDFKDKTKVYDIRDSLIKKLNKSIIINNHYLFISCAIGYALYPDDTNDFHKLVLYSDLAMLESKSLNYKDKSKRFDKSMVEKLNQQINITNALKEAIKNDEIDIVYQSIVNSFNNEIYFIEALARWKHSKYGNITPDIFFSIAEKNGLDEELDYYIINKVIKEFSEVKKIKKYENCKVSINVNPATLLNPQLPNKLKKVILSYNLRLEDVCIEINENTFVNNIKDCARQILNLKKIGVKVALDDFGSKYSSLSILDEVEFDIIKIDRSFINKINHKSYVKSILKMIREVSLNENKDVVIEGVETKEQLEVLNSLGFNLIQGFYYSKPQKLL